MPSLKDLRRRIRSVESTKLITRAMRSVAASKMRRTQERRDMIKPYAERLQEMLVRVLRSVGTSDQPLMTQHDTDKRLVVAFASDRGLCGAFNNTINRYVGEYLQGFDPGTVDLYIVGKRAYQYFKKRDVNIISYHTEFSGDINAEKILAVANELTSLFLSGTYSQVELVFNRAITAMSYRPTRQHFLPLSEEELAEATQESAESVKEVDYIFEPDPKTLLSDLLPKFIETKIFYTFVNAFAAEHQARMMSMTTANQNCIELLDTLLLQMNKARQTSITNEILEIVGGAEALQG